MSRTSKSPDRSKIVSLREKVNRLNQHWSTGLTGVPLDAFNSDEIYKHHLHRLKKVYTEHELPAEMDFRQFKPVMMTAPGPITQLYGYNGLLRLSPRTLERTERMREQGWNSSFSTPAEAAVNVLRRRDRSDESPSESGRKVHSPKPSSSTPSPPRIRQTQKREKDNSTKSFDAVHAGMERISHRSNDPDLSEEELILRGLYRLNKNEETVYNQFVEMLSNYDRYDMLNIINDVFRDAQNSTQLSKYGGIEI